MASNNGKAVIIPEGTLTGSLSIGVNARSMSKEERAQLATAYEHSQTTHIQHSDIEGAVQTYVQNNRETLKGDQGEPGIQGPKGDKGDKGDTGAVGKDGLTTSIKVNGSTYTHSNGTITLPNYPNLDNYYNKTETYSKSEIDEQLDDKANKNEIFSMANMGQDIKEAMAGGSVAVVGKNAITLENVVDEQINISKVDFITKSNNLYNSEKDILKHSILGGGKLIENNGVNTTDYIYVNSNSKYTFKGFSRYALYDIAKNFLGLANTVASDVNTITTDKNACFIRLHYENYSTILRQFNKGETLATYDEFSNILDDTVKIKALDDTIIRAYKTFDNIINRSENLLDKDRCIIGSIINDKGSVLPGFADWYYSDKIYVLPNTEYTMRFTTYQGGAEYDVDGNFIQKIGLISGNTSPYTFKTHKNCYYIVVNGQKSNLETDMVVKGRVYPTDFIPFSEKIKERFIDGGLNELLESALKKSNFLYGKKIATAGDSITNGLNPSGGLLKNYGQLMAERNGMTFYNYGIAGSTLSNVSGKNPFCVDRYLKMADNLDYLTIWFGWNDHAYSTLGTINDTIDTTFYGAWNKVLPALIEKYPLCKIGLIVPYGCDAGFRQAVRDVGKKWGIPYLDLESVNTPLIHLRGGIAGGIDVLRRSTFTYDTTHLNQEGYDYMSTFYENFIRSL